MGIVQIMSRYTLNDLNPVADSARSLVDYFRARFPSTYAQLDSQVQLRQRQRRASNADSVGSVAELRENFLLPQVQTSTIEQLPYRTPWHQGWKQKEYKGALNPQAHSQNSFESERTFHGGDNVIIETFADADLKQNIDRMLFWNAISASTVIFGLQFYRYKSYMMYVDSFPFWSMMTNCGISVGSLVLTFLQCRQMTQGAGLVVMLLAIVQLLANFFTLILDFKLLIVWPHQLHLTAEQKMGFLHLIVIHLMSSLVMLPVFQFLRLSLMRVQSMRNQYDVKPVTATHKMHAF